MECGYEWASFVTVTPRKSPSPPYRWPRLFPSPDLLTVYLCCKEKEHDNYNSKLSLNTISSPQGSFVASITALDYDPLSSDDVIDRHQQKVNVIPTSWVSPTKWQQMTLGGNPSTTTLQYSVQCNQDYYGPRCTSYCIARDDDLAGHYTCDKATGYKVCRAGWHGLSCKVFCMPNDDDTHGHYTCESGTGRKICRQNWYGSTCKVHCAPRNDSLAGYYCNSQGQRVCLQNWYGENKCDVYCKQTDDPKAGYTCDINGNKIYMWIPVVI